MAGSEFDLVKTILSEIDETLKVQRSNLEALRGRSSAMLTLGIGLAAFFSSDRFNISGISDSAFSRTDIAALFVFGVSSILNLIVIVPHRKWSISLSLTSLVQKYLTANDGRSIEDKYLLIAREKEVCYELNEVIMNDFRRLYVVSAALLLLQVVLWSL